MTRYRYALLRQPDDAANVSIPLPSYVRYSASEGASRNHQTKVTTAHSPRLSFMVDTSTLQRRSVAQGEAEANIGAHLFFHPIAFIRGDEETWSYGFAFEYSWSDSTSTGALDVLSISGEKIIVPFIPTDEDELTRVSLPIIAAHPAYGVSKASLSLAKLHEGHSALKALFNAKPPANRARHQLRQLRAVANFPDSASLETINVVAPDGRLHTVQAQTALDVLFHQSRPSSTRTRRAKLPSNWFGDDAGAELRSEAEDGDEVAVADISSPGGDDISIPDSSEPDGSSAPPPNSRLT